MQPILLLLLLLAQYAATAWALLRKKHSLLALICIYSAFSYDYIFINASYYLPPWLVALLKPFSEYLILYFIVRLILGRKQSFSPFAGIDAYVIWLVCVPSAIVLLASDLAHYHHYGEAVLGIRLYLVPLLLAYLLYKSGVLAACRQAWMVNTIFLFSICSGIYGFFQKAWFNGDVQTLWFYKFFTKYAQNPIDYGPANYIRDAKLRVTGYYVSPITYSLAFALPILTILAIFADSWHRMAGHIRALLCCFLAFFLCYQWLSLTRIGLIVDFIGCVLIVLAKLKRPRFEVLLLVPVSIVLATFGMLMLKTTNEVSALGRLDQYYDFLRLYSFFGLGFHDALVQTHFDTYFVSLSLLYGVFSFFPLLFLYKTAKAAHRIVVANEGNYLYEGAFFFLLTFAYTFCFQFIAGSTPYKLYFLLLFVILANGQFATSRSMQARHYRFIPY